MTRQPDSAVHRRRGTLPEHPVDHDTSADVDLRAGAVDGGSGRSKLRGMKRFRRIVAAVIACTAFAALACRREKPVAAADSAARRPVTGSDSSLARAPSTWDPGAGALLLVATDSPTKALVVLPTESDTTPIATIPHPASVTLFGRGGSVQTADLPSVRDSLGCLVAPLTAAPPPHAWSIGFVGGVVTPLAVDSAASIDHADSARLRGIVESPRVEFAERSRRPIYRPAIRRPEPLALFSRRWTNGRRRLARATNQSGSDAASGANACRRGTTGERHVVHDGLRRALLWAGTNRRKPRATGRAPGWRLEDAGHRPVPRLRR